MGAIAGHLVVAYANAAGFINEDLLISAAVAKAESGWDPSNRYVTSEEDSRGLWQINTYAHPEFNLSRLFEPDYNAGAAWVVWHNAGNRWRPWTTYTRGTYLQYLPDAQQAINDFRSLGGDPGTTTGIVDNNPPPPVASGLYPNFGPFDPAPAVRELAFRFADWAGYMNGARQILDNAIAEQG